MPIGLSTPGTGGQYNVQFAGLPLASSNVGIGTAATPPSSTQYTNTTPAYSSQSPLSKFENAIPLIPSYLASAISNLPNLLINPPGYTPGGGPLAILTRTVIQHLSWFSLL